MSTTTSKPTRVLIRRAVLQALHDEMENDPDVIVMGEDIAVAGGTVQVHGRAARHVRRAPCPRHADQRDGLPRCRRGRRRHRTQAGGRDDVHRVHRGRSRPADDGGDPAAGTCLGVRSPSPSSCAPRPAPGWASGASTHRCSTTGSAASVGSRCASCPPPRTPTGCCARRSAIRTRSSSSSRESSTASARNWSPARKGSSRSDRPGSWRQVTTSRSSPPEPWSASPTKPRR